MVIIKISDGLGNQMFQYALGLSVALHRSDILKLDISSFNKNYKLRSFSLEKFSIEIPELSYFERIKYILFSKYVRKITKNSRFASLVFRDIYHEKKCFNFDCNVFDSNCEYFDGYWQDYRYFDKIRDKLLKVFSMIGIPNKNNHQVLEQIKKSEAVSIHIRRGDYLNIQHQQVCDIDYYHRAIKTLLNDISNKPTFFVFSDDIKWVRDNLDLPYRSVFVDFNQNNPEWDFELIKNCKHNIIANSTFSWWGAWLNNYDNKIVIAPKEWMIGFPTPIGLVPDGWKLL